MNNPDNSAVLIDPKALLNSLHAGVVVHGPDTRILYANPRALEILRLTLDQAFGKDAFDPGWRFVDEHRQVLAPEEYPVNRVLASGQPITNQVGGIMDGSSNQVTWVLVNAYPERDEEGTLTRVVVTFIDITSEKRDIPFEQIIAHARDAVVVTEAHPLNGEGPRIVYVNAAFTDLSGYTAEEVIGRSPRLLQGPNTDPETCRRIGQALRNHSPIREQLINYTKDGREYWVDLNIFPLHNRRGEVNYFAAIERDITVQKLREHTLIAQAITDPLTGLLNRRGFLEGAQEIYHAWRDHQVVALAMIDIDFFKQINDHYGHPLGDQVLIHLAQLLRTSFRKSDVIGRFGGEEFAVFLPGASLEHAKLLMDNFRQRLASTPCQLSDGQSLGITVSIGIAGAPGSQLSLTQLIKIADRSLYMAKHSGRNCVRIAESAAGDLSLSARLSSSDPGQVESRDRAGFQGS